jgi:FkbH-like protein
MRPGVLDVITALDQRGVLQSICSKNDREPALKVLERLGIRDYFLYPMINWNPKSGNLQSIARLLNIDVNTFGFIDDSAFERSEVAAALPQVRVYSEAEIDTLPVRPELDLLCTKESAGRRQMYQVEEKRRNTQDDYTKQGGAPLEFLRSCQLCLRIFVPQDEDALRRGYELLTRTNQLNLSARKYTLQEFEDRLCVPGLYTYAVSCWDRFGDYGQIAFLQGKYRDKDFVVDEFAMSCRVAEKCVENAIIHWLKDNHKTDGGALLFQGVQTLKNQLLKNSLLKANLKDLSQTGEIALQLRFDEEPSHWDIVSIAIEIEGARE